MSAPALPGTVALTVIVPATDRPPTLGRSVGAIEPQLEPGDELIVVEECAAPGPAAARNEGARRAGGDVLVFVDADVVVHPDALGARASGVRRRSRRSPRSSAPTTTARGARRRLPLPQPAPSPRPPPSRGRGGELLGGARRGPGKRVRAGRGLRRPDLRAALDRGHRARHPSGRLGRPDRLRPDALGDPSEALDPRLDAAHRRSSTGGALGRAADP